MVDGLVEDLIESVTRGNVTQVKVVLASVVVALAVYQVLLMAVGYGKLHLPFLRPRAASLAHRAAGRFLPHLGLTVFVLFVVTWATSAGDYLWGA
jgi:Family of unknown function (DUF6529)